MHHRHSSSTARLIARCSLLAASEPSLSALVPADAEEALTAMLRADGGIGWFGFAVRHAGTRALLRRIEGAILPGIIAHFLARKRWIERAVLSALDEGCRQVVVIGAGLDTLAWRLHRARPGVTFWELDHPASQLPKADALRRLTHSDNLALVPLDLRTALPSAALVKDPRFQPSRRTCFVAEGLFMYLPESRVLAVLADATQFEGARVVFTFMELDATGKAAFRGGSPLIEKWLQARSEPFVWAIPRGQLADFVAPLGLLVRSVAGADELRTEILGPAGLTNSALAAGECVAMLSRNS